jgi:O-succinylbenzoate synthase
LPAHIFERALSRAHTAAATAGYGYVVWLQPRTQDVRHVLRTLPRELVAYTGVDALTHAVEATLCREGVRNPISCALAELDGSLPQEANYRAAPLCTGDPDELFALLSAMPGEKVAKIKVGLYEAVRDGMVANLLLEAIPDLRLRLDANRAWTPLKAQQFAKYVNPAYRSRIAFLEEPCKTRDDSRAFARETGIAIAWDESLREADFAFVAEPGVSAVVIKPTLTGSLDKVREQVTAAHALGLTAVISSSIESSLGLTQLARIAAWLTPDTIPGLDTLNLMQAQLVRQWPDSTLPCLDVEALEPLL